jgi:hypothetical protein
LDVLFPMALVSDEGLTEEELREKRKQVFLRNTTEGRRRKKVEHMVLAEQRQADANEEEMRRLADPIAFDNALVITLLIFYFIFFSPFF